VKLSLSAVREFGSTDAGRKKLRYAGVSVVFVPLGQILIQVLGRYGFHRNFTKASLASAAILTVPNFFANKIVVWRNTAKDNLRTQVVVFWVAAMLGVGLATLLTWYVERRVAGKSALVESAAVFAAQIVGFGVVWVARFLVLDRWLFKATHHGAEPTAAEVSELHSDFPV
jgi:putative flippase GtrA